MASWPLFLPRHRVEVLAVDVTDARMTPITSRSFSLSGTAPVATVRTNIRALGKKKVLLISLA
ncbi:MAG TPA: hypothetical protein VHV55_02135 [Pirellulales bacterium]|jgi:hypothetical protein|nr:hypothetical protein [Pirellulales bacterium]